GTEDEEFRVAAVIDRVNTTMEVWQSTNIGCVQCHSHPYDPFRNKEYYKLMAFFNNTRDEDTEGEHPNLRFFKEPDQKKLEAISSWVRENTGEENAKSVEKFLRTLEPKIHPHEFDKFVNGELIDTKWLGIRHGGSARLPRINMANKSTLIMNYFTQDVGGSLEIRLDGLNGTRIALAKIDSIKSGFRAIAIPLVPTTGTHDLYFIFRNPSIDPQRSVNGVEWLAFRNDNFRDPIREREFMKLVNSKTDDTPIFIENGDEQHRKTQIFERGNWLVKGEEVQPATPQSLNPFPKDAPNNRLGLAQWLMAKDNPLTARTLVNRVWEQVFGAGLAETLEDLGTQGATPTHPELLDWLSLRVSNDHQWSIKKLMKDIMLSATYRQDSRVSKDKLEKDPSNKWLARGPRVRLSGEQVRDQALTVSGLLSDKMYGKSVMPYQPDGVWQSVWSDEKWIVSKGEDRYRRAIYTFQKRTSPYPSMMTFDGSSREVCQVRRIRTNTPLQSLVTLNDPVYLDAARALAKKMRAAGKSTEEQIKAGYSMIVFDEMSDEKLAALDKLYRESLSIYQSDAKLKSNFLKEGSADEASMILVASALLNLDETLTKK
ncbi:MAG: DUF1553 domain-containing protein, partial [Cyclobacteriaceae bacterium]|nr:DUF1553 domain-containing protein [Cyclobacteriaceae bacterium]